jgi:hypothetical protein
VIEERTDTRRAPRGEDEVQPAPRRGASGFAARDALPERESGSAPFLRGACPTRLPSRVEGYTGGDMPSPTYKYLFLHRSVPGAGQANASPEDMQAMFARWNAWKEKFKDNIVDWGDKLKSEGMIVSSSSVSDGPFIEAKEIIGGFMIVAAESLDHAVAIAREMPAMQPGARIEVREMAGAKM